MKIISVFIMALLLVSCMSHDIHLKTTKSKSMDGVIFEKTAIYGHGYGQALTGSALARVLDSFTIVLLDKGYRVISRSDTQAIMEELKIQISDLTEEQAIELGRQLNVKYFLLVTVTECTDFKQVRKFTSYFTANGCALSAKLLDLNTCEIMWQATAKGTSSIMEETPHDLLESICLAVAENFPSYGHWDDEPEKET